MAQTNEEKWWTLRVYGEHGVIMTVACNGEKPFQFHTVYDTSGKIMGTDVRIPATAANVLVHEDGISARLIDDRLIDFVHFIPVSLMYTMRYDKLIPFLEVSTKP